MPYAIIRCQKCSSGAVAAAEKHNLRKCENHANPDIDPTRSHLNEILIASQSISREVARQVDAIQATQKRKIRKDAPRALEYIVTASPEAFESLDQQKYFQSALDFLKDRHGDNRIVSAVIHRDETTPHLHVVVVPVKDGKLNARHFMSREALKTLQNDFGALGIGFGLQRGQENAQRAHFAVSEYKKRTQEELEKLQNDLKDLREQTLAPVPKIEVPRPRLFQSKESYGLEVANSTLEQLDPHWRRIHAKARERDALKAENDRLKAENISLKEDLNKVRTLYTEVKKELGKAKVVFHELFGALQAFPEMRTYLDRFRRMRAEEERKQAEQERERRRYFGRSR